MRSRRAVIWSLTTVLVLGVIAVGLGFWHAGYRAYVVHTGSMESTLMPGDLIIDRPASDSYQPGQIITFRHSTGPDLVTHRITDITAAGIHTKGDANRSADVWDIPPSYVQGSVRWQLPGFGYAVTFLRQPTGFAAIVAAIFGLILLWGLFFPPSSAASKPIAAPDAADDDLSAVSPWTEPPPRDSPGRRHPDESGANAEVPVPQHVPV